MSHHDDESNLTVKAFFDHYGMIVFFGILFLMMMFLPLLFLPGEYFHWFTIGILSVLGGIAILVLMMKFSGKGSH